MITVVVLRFTQLKVRDVLEKYDEVILGDKKDSFQLGNCSLSCNIVSFVNSC